MTDQEAPVMSRGFFMTYMEMTMDPVTIERRREDHLVTVAVSATTLYGLITSMAGHSRRIDEVPFYFLFMLFFCALSVGILVNALRAAMAKGPGLVLGPDGLTDAITPVHAGEVSWQAMSGVRTTGRKGQWVLVDLKDPQAFIQALDGFKARLAENLLKQNGSPLAIPVRRLKVSSEDLQRMLSERIRAAVNDGPVTS